MLTLNSDNANFTGTVIATNGGTLDLNGAGIGEVTVQAAGAGVGGNGAIINSGADQIHAVNIVNLLGDTVFGGPGRWDIRYNGSQNASLSGIGGTFNLTKTGANLVVLVNCGIDYSIGNIDIQGGTLGFQLASTTSASEQTVYFLYPIRNL